MKLVRDKIISFLRQGLTPRDIALALALGVVLGTFPVIGATSLLCVAASVVFRLNLLTLQSVNWAVSPLQLLLLLPFFRLGSAIFGGADVTVGLTALIAMMRADLIGSMREFLSATLRGIGAWALAALPAAGLMYLCAFPLITRVQREVTRVRSDDDAAPKQRHGG